MRKELIGKAPVDEGEELIAVKFEGFIFTVILYFISL
jgi:hypothetical protein